MPERVCADGQRIDRFNVCVCVHECVFACACVQPCMRGWMDRCLIRWIAAYHSGMPLTIQDCCLPFRIVAYHSGLPPIRCNRPEFPPSQFFPRGKTGPAHSFPGEKTD